MGPITLHSISMSAATARILTDTTVEWLWQQGRMNPQVTEESVRRELGRILADRRVDKNEAPVFHAMVARLAQDSTLSPDEIRKENFSVASKADIQDMSQTRAKYWEALRDLELIVTWLPKATSLDLTYQNEFREGQRRPYQSNGTTLFSVLKKQGPFEMYHGQLLFFHPWEPEDPHPLIPHLEYGARVLDYWTAHAEARAAALREERNSFLAFMSFENHLGLFPQRTVALEREDKGVDLTLEDLRKTKTGLKIFRVRLAEGTLPLEDPFVQGFLASPIAETQPLEAFFVPYGQGAQLDPSSAAKRSYEAQVRRTYNFGAVDTADDMALNFDNHFRPVQEPPMQAAMPGFFGRHAGRTGLDLANTLFSWNSLVGLVLGSVVGQAIGSHLTSIHRVSRLYRALGNAAVFLPGIFATVGSPARSIGRTLLILGGTTLFEGLKIHLYTNFIEYFFGKESGRWVSTVSLFMGGALVSYESRLTARLIAALRRRDLSPFIRQLMQKGSLTRSTVHELAEKTMLLRPMNTARSGALKQELEGCYADLAQTLKREGLSIRQMKKHLGELEGLQGRHPAHVTPQVLEEVRTLVARAPTAGAETQNLAARVDELRRGILHHISPRQSPQHIYTRVPATGGAGRAGRHKVAKHLIASRTGNGFGSQQLRSKIQNPPADFTSSDLSNLTNGRVTCTPWAQRQINHYYPFEKKAQRSLWRRISDLCDNSLPPHRWSVDRVRHIFHGKVAKAFRVSAKKTPRGFEIVGFSRTHPLFYKI